MGTNDASNAPSNQNPPEIENASPPTLSDTERRLYVDVHGSSDTLRSALATSLDSGGKELVVATILSLGACAGLIVFIIEAFNHPSAATVLVPLIVGPLGAAIVRFVQQRKEKSSDSRPGR